MKIGGIFDNTIQTLERSLDIRARKHEVIVSNIANVDTPNYKAFELIVEDELANMESNKNLNNLTKTHPLHLSAKSQNGDNFSTSRLHLSEEVTLRGDGNTVNMEKEMAELAENNIMYRTSADILSQKFQSIIKAIYMGKK
jgi:flagellar basal-body rod protein FlgB